MRDFCWIRRGFCSCAASVAVEMAAKAAWTAAATAAARRDFDVVFVSVELVATDEAE